MSGEKRFTEFEERLKDALKEVLGDEVPLKAVNVTKNNGVVHRGIIIGEEEISPTIYYDKLYQQYKWGMSIGAIARKIGDIYRESMGSSSEVYKAKRLLEDYNAIRDRLIIRVINYECNMGLLNSLPHRRVQDLCVIYVVVLSEISESIATVTVNHNLLKMWGISEEELSIQAYRNNLKLLPYVFMSIEDQIMSLKNKDYFKGSRTETECGIICKEYDTQHPLYIVTNRINLYAASVLVYPDILHRISQELGGDYIIIPSSVHEILCIKDDDLTEYDEILRMVREVNTHDVLREEVLSDSIYVYRTAGKMLLRIEQDVVEKQE